jgi:hypothetical protein
MLQMSYQDSLLRLNLIFEFVYFYANNHFEKRYMNLHR